MSQETPSSTPDQLLPWYAAHALSPEDRRAVETWLNDHPEGQARLAEWQQVRSGVLSQPKAVPSPRHKRELMARLQTDRQTRARRIRLAGFTGAVIALAMLFVLWVVVQPGIALEWSVAGDGAQTYRVYRAPNGSNQFSLLQELPAKAEAHAYSFTDISLLPGQSYTYRVEAVTVNGQSVASQTVIGDSLAVLPAQLALLCSSLAVGLAAAYVMSVRGGFTKERRAFGA